MSGRDKLPPPGAEVIHYRHVMTCRYQTISYMRADETGAAGDQNTSHLAPREKFFQDPNQGLGSLALP